MLFITQHNSGIFDKGQNFCAILQKLVLRSVKNDGGEATTKAQMQIIPQHTHLNPKP
jgi:hypothetical protein